MPGAKTAAEIEPLGAIDIVGHSHNAEVGASKLKFGSMHKYASLFPARFRNLAVGGAILVKQGTLGPRSAVGNENTQAGWAWIAANYPADERTFGLPGTTLTAAANAIGAATPLTVADSAQVYPSSERYGTPVIVGTGAAAELNWVIGAPAGTSLTLSQNLVNSHPIGAPVYMVPDAWLAPRQFVIGEWSWHDLAILGPTEMGVSFKHSLRTVLAMAAQVVRWQHDHVSVRSSGTWTPGTNVNIGSPTTFASTTVTTAYKEVETPPNFEAGSAIDLHFLTIVTSGNGALWTLTYNGGNFPAGTKLNGVDIGGTQPTFDSRNQQAIAYGSTHAAPAAAGTTGNQPVTARITGLPAGGQQVIRMTPGTIQGAAYFWCWGIEAPIRPICLLPTPARMLGYSLYSDTTKWAYGGVMNGATYSSSGQELSDINAVSAVIQSVADEFAPYAFTRPKDPLIHPGGTKTAKYYIYDGAHYNDAGFWILVKDWANALKQRRFSVGDLLAPTPTDKRGLYPVTPAGGRGSTTFLNGWSQAAGYQETGYYLDITTQRCHVQGACSGGTKNAPMFRLPPGHRPSSPMPVSCMGYLGPGFLEVDASGYVYGIQNQSVNLCYFNFDFPVEA